MKNIFLVLVFILLSGAAQATQNHIFACSYLEGKGPADLEKWFNEYGKAGLDNAGGNAKITVLTPSVNNNPEYDFIWIEEYEDFEALGKQAIFLIRTEVSLSSLRKPLRFGPATTQFGQARFSTPRNKFLQQVIRSQ